MRSFWKTTLELFFPNQIAQREDILALFPENQDPKIYSVSELTQEIQNLLEDRFDFVWVEGEISNFSAPISGHYYMVIKDQKAQIRAVMFRLQAGTS